jgi:hypothetical protein
MSNADTAVFFYYCRDGVAELLEAGANMHVVEDMIDASALPGEDKDALWLWASGRADRHIVPTRARVQLVPG